MTRTGEGENCRYQDWAQGEEIQKSSSLPNSFPEVLPPRSMQHMAGVQNSRSKGSYKVGPIGIEKLILHLRYEAGPIGNHAVPKLGASIALAWR